MSGSNFQSGYNGGIAFLGNDAYFAWSGQPNGGSADAVQGSRWRAAASQPDDFTDLDASGPAAQLTSVVADEDGGVAAFWTLGTGGSAILRAAAFDAGGPNVLSASVPGQAAAGQPVTMTASVADLWSGLGAGPNWAFGDGATGAGASVRHTYATAGSYMVTVTM